MKHPTYESGSYGQMKRDGVKFSNTPAGRKQIVVDFRAMTDDLRRFQDFARTVYNSPDLASFPIRNLAARLLGEKEQ